MAFIVPPGGHAGFMQMTPASKASLFPPGRRGTSARRAKRKTTKTRTKRARKSKGKRKLKFGSPAWRKKYM
jgi:hypothetical protein